MSASSTMRRRDFLRLSGAGVASGLVGLVGPARPAPASTDDVDGFFAERMSTLHIPGLAGILVKEGTVVWSKAYGVADMEKRTPMTVDTLQNIASISKTVTPTALMQLWEARKLKLEDPVDRHLPFAVRNPAWPEAPITFRQLLTHTSSIDDRTTYSRHYACGDPDIALGDWIGGYFTPGGRFYDARENFHDWRPGERYSYDNLAFGLLGHVVEAIADVPFSDYCRERIFAPLGMTETSWFLAGIDRAWHAVPYTWVDNGSARGPTWGGEAQGAIGESGPTGAKIATLAKDGYEANCLYSHPNYPDGFLRTSVRQLSHYLLAYLASGGSILRRSTVDTMLEVQSEKIWGLSWYQREAAGHAFWGHGGADPGVNTRIDLNREDGVGAIVFVNTFLDSGANEMRELNERLLRLAYV
jgi:CubicO group peptidase (beta-lactamase class C family)